MGQYMLKENLYTPLHGHSIWVSVWSLFSFGRTVLEVKGLNNHLFQSNFFFPFSLAPCTERELGVASQFLWALNSGLCAGVFMCVYTHAYFPAAALWSPWTYKKRPHCPLLHFYRYRSSVSLISIHGGKESWKALEWGREKKKQNFVIPWVCKQMLRVKYDGKWVTLPVNQMSYHNWESLGGCNSYSSPSKKSTLWRSSLQVP